jgi:hypothetical protein
VTRTLRYGLLAAVSIATLAVPIATGAGIGLWASTARARWQLAAREGRERRENQLHRQRFGEVWQQLHEGPDRAAALNCPEAKRRA